MKLLNKLLTKENHPPIPRSRTEELELERQQKMRELDNLNLVLFEKNQIADTADVHLKETIEELKNSRQQSEFFNATTKREKIEYPSVAPQPVQKKPLCFFMPKQKKVHYARLFRIKGKRIVYVLTHLKLPKLSPQAFIAGCMSLKKWYKKNRRQIFHFSSIHIDPTEAYRRKKFRQLHGE